MTALFVIESGQAAPSLSTLARGGLTVVAASVCADHGRLNAGQQRPTPASADCRRAWRQSCDNGHESLSVAGRYRNSKAIIPSDVALG